MTLPESSSSIDTYSDSAGDHENLPPPFNQNNNNHSNTFQQTIVTTIKQPVKPIKSLEQPLPPRTQNFPDTQLRAGLLSPNSELKAEQEIQRVFSLDKSGQIRSSLVPTNTSNIMSNNMHTTYKRTHTTETVTKSNNNPPKNNPNLAKYGSYTHPNQPPPPPRPHQQQQQQQNLNPNNNSQYLRAPSRGRSDVYSPAAEFVEKNRQQYNSGVTRQHLNNMAESLGPELLKQRTNEKDKMVNLNNRFASYIEKVRSLEQQNKILETKLIQQQSVRPANTDKLYGEELSRLREEVNKLTTDKERTELQRDNLVENAKKWRDKYDDEHQLRKEHEMEVGSLRKDYDDATLVRTDLERRLETTVEEIEFLKRCHSEEIREFKEQLTQQQSIRIEQAPGPDLLSELDKMRDYYESLADKNRAEMDEWANSRVQQATEQAARDKNTLNDCRHSIHEYKKQVENMTTEIRTLRDQNGNLKRQLDDEDQAHRREIDDYQNQLRDIQNKFEDIKGQMADQLRQYQELMSVKIALDLEIATYRKLLEGEETRIDNIYGQQRR